MILENSEWVLLLIWGRSRNLESALDLWLTCFPSFGYILSVPEPHAREVRRRFLARDLACEIVGRVNPERVLDFRWRSEQRRFWTF